MTCTPVLNVILYVLTSSPNFYLQPSNNARVHILRSPRAHTRYVSGFQAFPGTVGSRMLTRTVMVTCGNMQFQFKRHFIRINIFTELLQPSNVFIQYTHAVFRRFEAFPGNSQPNIHPHGPDIMRQHVSFPVFAYIYTSSKSLEQSISFLAFTLISRSSR